MMRCRKYRGLIAASLYGDLGKPERADLEKHLASCDSCRHDMEALARLVSQLPDDAPELDRDLAPALRRRLNELGSRSPAGERRAAYATGGRWALAAAACVLVVAALAYLAIPRAPGGPVQVANLTASETGAAGLATILDQTADLLDTREYTRAVRVLADAIEACPDDAKAGEAQRLLADITFDKLRWYDKADEAYRVLAARYPEVLGDSPESVQRRDLLAEARVHRFEPLYKLDAAKRGGEKAFAKLEQVVSHYPATFVASLAAGEMAAMMVGNGAPGEVENGHLYAMEHARARCTEPVAVGQLTLEMGLIYWEEMSDPNRARDLYNEVAEGDHVVLAQRELAHNLLSVLPAP